MRARTNDEIMQPWCRQTGRLVNYRSYFQSMLSGSFAGKSSASSPATRSRNRATSSAKIRLVRSSACFRSSSTACRCSRSASVGASRDGGVRVEGTVAGEVQNLR